MIGRFKILFLLFFICILKIYAQVKYPILKEFVTDNAEVFSIPEQLSLEKKLLNFELETTNQIVVVTIKSLAGAVLEQYANKLFETNAIGQHKEDNGVLILISKNDRKLRIEVGNGLEHVLTDAKCSRVIRNILVPKFKTEDYFEGVNGAIDQIIVTIQSPLADNFRTNKEITTTKAPLPLKGLRIFFCIIAALGFSAFLFGIIKLLFIKSYENLINIHRGLIVGKIGVFHYFIFVFFAAIDLMIALVFMFLIFIGGITICVLIIDPSIDFIDKVIHFKHFTVFNFVFFLSALVILIPLLLAFLFKKQVENDPFRLSLKNDDNYLRVYMGAKGSFKTSRFSSKGYSSSGSRSYSSSSYSSSSSSSSSSFSGGGGSSSGGGASGSW